MLEHRLKQASEQLSIVMDKRFPIKYFFALGIPNFADCPFKDQLSQVGS